MAKTHIESGQSRLGSFDQGNTFVVVVRRFAVAPIFNCTTLRRAIEKQTVFFPHCRTHIRCVKRGTTTQGR